MILYIGLLDRKESGISKHSTFKVGWDFGKEGGYRMVSTDFIN